MLAVTDRIAPLPKHLIINPSPQNPKGGLNIRLSKMLTGYDIDVYREIEEEDVALTEFADEIDGWVIDALKAAGCDTAKSVLELPVEEIAARADLELEQAQKVVEILKAEFE